MSFKNLLPCALVACFALVLPLSVAAQKGQRHVRLVAKIYKAPSIVSEDPVIISLASAEQIKASKPLIEKGGGLLQFRDLMTAAIDQRLGSPYSWGGTGPSAFDCSGFVWSTFKSVGIDFERGSARTLWSRFTPPAPDEQYKFGTLVFFSNLAHVGIVVDEYGFYHASRRHGVIYSPFNDYWLSRVDGFRKVPMPAAPAITNEVTSQPAN
ncbi:MAG TPA: C40 family peptidase [Pyrinomonadaceae bacterium]|nr:C40 family peptidase [Pyrinomonadaceae bacterium]